MSDNANSSSKIYPAVRIYLTMLVALVVASILTFYNFQRHMKEPTTRKDKNMI
jgi:hypothetical protein